MKNEVRGEAWAHLKRLRAERQMQYHTRTHNVALSARGSDSMSWMSFARAQSMLFNMNLCIFLCVCSQALAAPVGRVQFIVIVIVKKVSYAHAFIGKWH